MPAGVEAAAGGEDWWMCLKAWLVRREGEKEGGGDEGREGGQMGDGWEKNRDRKREGQETKQTIILNHTVKSEQSVRAKT